jgi:molybdate transport system permease protein
VLASGPDTGTILWTTLRVALAATLLVAPVGIAAGHALARREFRGKSLVETFVALPLVLPPTAIGYMLLALFARSGLLGERNLGFDPGLLFTWKAAVLASTVVALPLVARTARTAFEEVDPRLELMARTLGFSRARTLLRVTLPLARRGLLAAVALGFGRALGEFGATVIVAGNIPGRTQTLALAIFSEIQLGNTERRPEARRDHGRDRVRADVGRRAAARPQAENATRGQRAAR